MNGGRSILVEGKQHRNWYWRPLFV